MIIPEAFQVPSGTRPVVVKAAWSWGGEEGHGLNLQVLLRERGFREIGGRGTRAHQETRRRLA